MQENLIQKTLYNIEAEQIILGKIISNNDYYSKVSDYLKEEYFYELAHRIIFKHIAETIQKTSIIADSVTLKNFFENNEILESIGGTNYLSIILSKSSGIFDIVSYAKIIQDLAIKRNLILINEETVSNIYNSDKNTTAFEEIEVLEGKIFEISNNIETNKGFLNISNVLDETISNIDIAKKRESHISGIPCGFIDLDRILGGLQKSDLIIIAGRPSMGKTTLAINIAYNAAKEFLKEYSKTGIKKSVGFFSLEMPNTQISAKILSLETNLGTDRFRKGEITDEEFIKIAEKSNEISKVPLFIDDTAALSISSIKTRTRRLVKKENVGLIVIDYLQLIKGVAESSKTNRVLEISEITQGLKAIAKEFNIPIIALSQLSRSVEQREDKRPQLSDLRESGSIEQDADVVMFVYRESYYEERKRPNIEELDKMKIWQTNMDRIRNKSEIIIAKHRNGPIGNIEMYFNPDISKFDDYIGFNDI